MSRSGHAVAERVRAVHAALDSGTALIATTSLATAVTAALLPGNSVTHPGVRAAVITAMTIVGSWCFWRRRLTPSAAQTVVVVIIFAVSTVAFTYDSVTMRWACVLGIGALPMMTSVFAIERRRALTAIITCAAQVAVMASTGPSWHDLLVAALATSAVTMSLMGYTSHLLRVSEAARTAAESARAHAEHTATHDFLTGLLNRRGLRERLPSVTLSAITSSRHLAALLIDVDHFKTVNDVYGHAVGDATLGALGRVLDDGTRPEQLRARWGGEEFLVVGTFETIEDAIALAERLRVTVEHVEQTAIPTVTVSIGVATLPPPALSDLGHETFDHLLSRADAALYRAKAAGRNRVELSADEVGTLIGEELPRGACGKNSVKPPPGAAAPQGRL